MNRSEYLSQMIDLAAGPNRQSAVEYWHGLFLEGKIDLVELEERLGPAIEYDERHEL